MSKKVVGRHEERLRQFRREILKFGSIPPRDVLQRMLAEHNTLRPSRQLIQSESGPPEYWLLLPIDDEWTIGYRLEFAGEGARERARIAEVRILPRKPFEFLLPHRLSAPSTRPFSFERARRSLAARRVNDVLAAHVPGPSPWPTGVTSTPGSRKKGRPVKYGPQFYAAFAKQYDRIENAIKRSGTSTRDELAKRYKVSNANIGKWIAIARRFGFLSPVDRGQRGGTVTTKALELLNRQGKKQQ